MSLSKSLSRKLSFKSKPKPPKLSHSELMSLFRRLDTNGDGELSFKEFKSILTKLNLKSPGLEDSLSELFHSADTAGGKVSGSLGLEEFIVAYNSLYTKFVHGLDGGGAAKDETWVRATRYGYFGVDATGDKKYIFEMYAGPMEGLTEHYVYDLPNIPDDELFTVGVVQVDEIKSIHKTIAPLSLAEINDMIYADAERNAAEGSRVLWWVDVSSKKARDRELNAFAKAFGISADVKDNFHVLEEERLSRSTELVSPAKSGPMRTVQCINLFAQVLTVRNKPVVSRDPYWMTQVPYDIGTYISSRICLFYTYSGVKCREHRKAVILAQEEVDRLLDSFEEGDVGDDSGEDTLAKVDEISPSEDTAKLGGQESTKKYREAFETFTKPLPTPVVPGFEGAPYLIGTTDLAKRRPFLERGTLAMHIQNQGKGANALLTFRKMDSELKDRQHAWTIEQHSRAGILGRLLSGLWVKLLEISSREGVANIGAELDDSSFALAMMMTSLVHNVSMDTVQSLDLWMQQLTADIEELTATKHSKHIDVFNALLSELQAYVDGFNVSVEPLVTALLDTDSTTRFRDTTPAASASASAVALDKLPFDRLNAAEKVAVLRGFAPYNTVEMLPQLVHGIEKLEKKGSAYWAKQLTRLETLSGLQKDKYQVNLDEKRNFWGFALGIVTIVTFPFAVMTGYFGMNFENMAEPNQILTNDFWPAFPGQYIMWFFTLIIYSLMFVLFLHYRIVDSAL